MKDRTFTPEDQAERAQIFAEYQAEFLRILESRGFNAATLQAVEKADCQLVIEAEPDEDTGKIELPPSIEQLVWEIFPLDIMLVKNVILAEQGGVIEMQVGDLRAGWEDDGEFITNNNVIPVASRISLYKEIYFNIEKGQMEAGSKYAHEPLFFEEGNQLIDSTVWAPRRLQISVLRGFIELLPMTIERTNSRIINYKKTDDDIFPL